MGVIATVKQLNKAAYHGREDVRGSELWMGTQFHGSRESRLGRWSCEEAP